MDIVNPSSIELEKILEELNYEFITSKGKKLHIKYRYPGLYEKNNISNLFVLKEQNLICSFLAVKTLSFIMESKKFNIFLIGSVYTKSNLRGKGYGSYLLKEIQYKYIDNCCDLGILWTTQHSYYENLGWILQENGLLLKAKKENLKSNIQKIDNVNEIFEAETEYFQVIDDFRTSVSIDYVERRNNNYLWGYGTVYSPGEKNILFAARANGKIVGYVAGVVSEDSIIIYEAIGDYTVILNIINKLNQKYDRNYIFFNLQEKSNSTRLLNFCFQNYIIEKPQITMFYLKDNIIFDEINKIYIPFLDRI